MLHAHVHAHVHVHVHVTCMFRACAGQVAACALEAAMRGRAEVVPGLLPRLYVGLTDHRLLPVPVARGLAAFCFADAPF